LVGRWAAFGEANWGSGLNLFYSLINLKIDPA
jgi:hypothetical protein